MRPEQVIIGLIVFLIAILATTTFIQENVSHYSISNESMVMLQEAEINISDFAENAQGLKDELYSDTGSDTDNTKESNLIWAGYTTIKKSVGSIQTQLKVSGKIAKRSGIKGFSQYIYLGVLIIVILLLFFIGYFLRGYQPSKRD